MIIMPLKQNNSNFCTYITLIYHSLHNNNTVTNNHTRNVFYTVSDTKMLEPTLYHHNTKLYSKYIVAFKSKAPSAIYVWTIQN